jgi:ATP-dependent helicase/nuclease subunit B
VFARLVAEAAAKGLEPPTLLALLKHPLFRLGAAQGSLKPAIEVLELALLRGTRPQAGSSGLAHDFERFRNELGKLRRQEVSSLHARERRTRLRDPELDRAQALITQLQRALARSKVFRPLSPTTSSNWRSAIAKFSPHCRPTSTALPLSSRNARDRRLPPRSTTCSAMSGRAD